MKIVSDRQTDGRTDGQSLIYIIYRLKRFSASRKTGDIEEYVVRNLFEIHIGGLKSNLSGVCRNTILTGIFIIFTLLMEEFFEILIPTCVHVLPPPLIYLLSSFWIQIIRIVLSSFWIQIIRILLSSFWIQIIRIF